MERQLNKHRDNFGVAKELQRLLNRNVFPSSDKKKQVSYKVSPCA
jgi:hypothetical protein